MRGKLKVTVTRTEDKPGAMPLVIVDMKEEREEIGIDLSGARTLIVDPDPFEGQLMLTEDMVLPLYHALQEYVREHYV